MSRYTRQLMLPDIGSEGQARLARAHVAVVGAGGLGCPALQYLAGAGVGRITVVDPDIVEDSNLHRQPIYRMADLGHPKALAAANHLRAFNPQVEPIARVGAVGPGNAPDLAGEADLIIDAADSFAVSYILSDAAFAAGKPMISASVLGQTGYVGGYCGGAPSLRSVFPDLPLSGATCATAGVLGPVVGVFGALLAQIALRVLLNASPSALGKMITADLAALTFGGFSFQGSPEPDQPFPFVAMNMLQQGDLVVDLREKDEAPCPVVPHAVRTTADDVLSLLPASGQRVVLCCRSGLRAWHAASRLRAVHRDDLALLATSACE